MIKKLWPFILVTFALGIWGVMEFSPTPEAQTVTVPTAPGSCSAPSGACSGRRHCIDYVTGVQYVCASGTWTASVGGITTADLCSPQSQSIQLFDPNGVGKFFEGLWSEYGNFNNGNAVHGNSNTTILTKTSLTNAFKVTDLEFFGWDLPTGSTLNADLTYYTGTWSSKTETVTSLGCQITDTTDDTGCTDGDTVTIPANAIPLWRFTIGGTGGIDSHRVDVSWCLLPSDQP